MPFAVLRLISTFSAAVFLTQTQWFGLFQERWYLSGREANRRNDTVGKVESCLMLDAV
jgi:hypothetical protein